MNKSLDFSNIKAVIFDMDGTMVDNSHAHKKAWMKFMKKYGIEMSEEEYQEKLSGQRNDAILKLLFGELEEAKWHEYQEEKEQLYRDLYALEIKEVDGLSNLIVYLKKHGLKIGIATTSYGKNRDFILHDLDFEDRFDVIIGSEHVTKGKPDPEIYLKAAKALEVDPKDCLAFEDTPAGIKAAKSAGMKAVGLLIAHNEEEMKNADLLIENFSQFQYI